MSHFLQDCGETRSVSPQWDSERRENNRPPERLADMTPNDDDRRAADEFAAWYAHYTASDPNAMIDMFAEKHLIGVFTAHRLASERRAYEKAADRVLGLKTCHCGSELCMTDGPYEHAAAAICALAGEG